MYVKNTIRALTLALAASFCTPMLAAEVPAATSAAPASAAVHPEVQRALEYTLPQADCTKPQMSRGNNDATAVERFQRAMKRYTGCLQAYDETLFNDLTFLHGSLAHGATKAQAEQIGTRLLAVAQAINLLKSGGVALSAQKQQQMAAMLPANPAKPAATTPPAPPAAPPAAH